MILDLRIDTDTLSPEEMTALLRLPVLTADELRHFAEHYNTTWHEAIAQNRNAPSDILANLKWTTHYTTRMLVACHSNTSSETLDKLSFDGWSTVQENVARNPNTPEATLIRMFFSASDFALQRSILDNPSLTLDGLMEISKGDLLPKTRAIVDQEIEQRGLLGMLAE